MIRRLFAWLWYTVLRRRRKWYVPQVAIDAAHDEFYRQLDILRDAGLVEDEENDDAESQTPEAPSAE